MIDIIYNAVKGFEILVFAIIAAILFYVIFQIIGAFKSLAPNQNVTTQISNVEQKYDIISYLSTWLIFGTIVGVGIMSIILAYLHSSHPIFFIFGFVLLIIGIFLSLVFGNVIKEIVANNEIVQRYFAQNPILLALIENFHIYVMLIGIGIIIAQLVPKT